MKAATRWCAFGTASIALMATVAGCGGSSTNLAPPAQLGGAAGSAIRQPSAQTLGKARIVIRIPKPAKDTRAEAPAYISPSTESLAIHVTDHAPQKFNLSATSPGCSATQTTGYLTCTETFAIPLGKQTLTATLYDEPDGGGAALSTGDATATIVAGKVATVSPAFDGIVTTAVVLLNGVAAASIPSGTSASVKVSVNAYDAKKNLISSNAYASPVKLTNSDTSGRTTLSASSVAKAGETVTLDYTGAAVATRTTSTVTPSVDGTAQRAGAATLTLTLNALSASPTTLTFSTAATQTIAVKESGYSGAFTATSSDTTVALVTASAKGPSATFTVTPVGGGSCAITVKDASGQKATVDVAISSGSIIVNGVVK